METVKHNNRIRNVYSKKKKKDTAQNENKF